MLKIENALMRIECPWKVRLRQCGAYFYEDRKSMGDTWKILEESSMEETTLRTSPHTPRHCLDIFAPTVRRTAAWKPVEPLRQFFVSFSSGFRLPDGHFDHCTVAWVFEHIFTK